MLFSSYVFLRIGLLALKYQKLLGNDFEENFFVTKGLCQKVLEIAEIELECFGADNVPHKDSLMIFSNHKSFIDPLVIIATINRPTTFVSKSEAFSYLFAKRYLEALNCISIDRFRNQRIDKEKIMATQREITRYLEKNNSLLIFPEGGTVKTEEIEKFKAASFRAPKEVNSYILPTYIEGTDKVFKKGFILSSEMKKVRIVYGEPFKPSELDVKNTKDIAIYTQEQVLRLKNR